MASLKASLAERLGMGPPFWRLAAARPRKGTPRPQAGHFPTHHLSRLSKQPFTASPCLFGVTWQNQVRSAVRLLCTFSLLLATLLCKAVASVAAFTENKGQWPDPVLYRVLLPNGALFVEKGAFTYVLRSGGAAHDHGLAPADHDHEPAHAHAFRVHFEGGLAREWHGGSAAGHYENFFLGNDPEQWGTGCRVFGEVTLEDVWPGVDLRLDGRHGLKYEFLVEPGTDPAIIRLRYAGHDHLSLKQGELVVSTSAGVVVEQAPVSWSSFFDGVDNQRLPVLSSFQVTGDVVSFHVKASRTLPLTIDPTLSFASYSGSQGNNFGFTATYDLEGHLYGGGIVFQPGYPTTLGVLDESFNGPASPLSASVDVGVSKWSVDGSSLVWSTYIGGLSSEAPHSMVVNEDNELYVFGHTGSLNFPTTPGCFDNTFAGGPALAFIIGYGFGQPNGSDMFVAHLNADATSLIGSTYIGGTDNDGINNDPSLAHNYGDSFRGEIIVDANGNPVVASTTASTTMPVANASQPLFGGGSQDGYCFRMDPTLSTVQWATYLGGSGADAAYGTQVDGNGQVFVTGGTTSADLPMSGTPFRAAFDGATDGYVMRYGADGSMLSSTFLGTLDYDQSYFVQLDTDDAVYVVGQTHGAYPVTPGKYTVANSSQFVHKLAHDLDASQWSTVFGNGSTVQDISPTAFLVSNCGQIYFSGWGGTVNANAGSLSSTVTGMELTPDAFQSTTDGNDFYLMVLEPDATGLNYATYFGGNLSAEHVDGGTSRFDKNGTIYQAVCAGCQANDDFPTTPGAWSNTNASVGCNLGVMKFDLLATVAIVGIDGPTSVCAPAEVQFTNSSIGGDTYWWEFGDGSTSAEAAPVHVYEEPGEYTVTMRLSDSFACAIADTAVLVITVLADPPVAVDPVPPVCPGGSVQVVASGGVSYVWSPTVGVSDPLIADPVITPAGPTTYQVLVTGECGQDSATVFIDVVEPVGSAGPDRWICAGENATLEGSGGGDYLWEPSASLSDAAAEDPLASPTDSTVYSVLITTPDGCLVNDTVIVAVDQGLPTPTLGDTLICEGATVLLIAPLARTYAWNAAADLSVERQISVAPVVPTLYAVTATNNCGSIVDSAFVDIRIPSVEAGPDTLVCSGNPVQLFASDGAAYVWSPAAPLDDASIRTPNATVFSPTTFSVTMTDAFGCMANASVFVDLHPVNPVIAYWDRIIDFGSSAPLLAVGNGTFTWSPSGTLDNDTSATPIANPLVATTYTVSMTDTNGCITTDQVSIIVPGILFIPNTFTPNGDGNNDAFGAWGTDITEIELFVFNRWGELIWTAADMSARWDGTYKGAEAPIDTYVWKVRATEIAGEVHDRVGHVNLVR